MLIEDIDWTHIEQLPSGWWAIMNPDGSRYLWQTFKNKGAATRARNFLRKP